jgi:transforming growth factor-beta-induced protein
MKASKSITGKGKIAAAMFLALSVFVASCSKEDDYTLSPEPQTDAEGLADIATILEKSEQFPGLFNEQDDMLKKGGKSSFKRPPTFVNLTLALVKTDLLKVVAKNQLTVLAPTDEAFQQLFAQLGVKSIRDLSADQLRPILLYHVIQGKVWSSQLKSGFTPTLNGSAVEVKLGNGVMFNDANVLYANIRALNGVIHVIDKVLLPPSQSLVDIAAGNPAFSILVSAVQAAGLDGVLATGGPFTVFAPTNDAFVALLAELKLNSVEELIAAIGGVPGLKKVLLYHVVDGRVYSSDLPAGPLQVTSLEGGKFTINASVLKITDANDRDAGLVPSLLNIQGNNGVIHVIDRVILPKL